MSDESDCGALRRKRIRQACLNCRRKKVRCGGEKPICTFCSRLSQTCVYAEDGRSHRQGSITYTEPAAEPTASLVASLSGQVASLESKLARMEETLGRFETLLSSLTQAQPAMAYPSPHSMTTFPPARAPCEAAAPSDLTSTSTALPATGLSVTRFQYPPVHTLLFAADVFFRFCHNQPYSLFHEATFRQRLASGELPEHQVWSMIASVRRYSTLPDLQLNDDDDAMFYAKRAWECMKLPWSGAVRDEEIVQTIQTIVLIVCIEHPAGFCASAYMKLGFALRLATQARMQSEPEASLPPVAREERRRTFWSLYLQDKLITLTQERFPILRDEECHTRLPCTEAAFRSGADEIAPRIDAFTGDCMDAQFADQCCPLALITAVASALSRVSQYVLRQNTYAEAKPPWSSSSPYAAIVSTLLQLDMHFGLGDPPAESLQKRCFVNGAIDQHLAGSYIYAKALFHLSHCLLHHPFLLQQRLQILGHKAPPSFMQTAWETCQANATSLTALKDMRNHNVIVLTSLYGYCTMVSGTIHVLAMNNAAASAREDGRRHYNAAMDFLRELSCYWKHAALMANRLERFYKQNKDRPLPLAPCKKDADALWQSVDYTLLSTPTRPGSPVPSTQPPPTSPEFPISSNQLFDFADLGMLDGAVHDCDAFSLDMGP